MSKEKNPLEVGDIKGKLTYLGNIRKVEGKKVADFLCSCGATCTKNYNYVKTGQTSSCGGCPKKSKNKKDITGIKKNKLTALSCTGEKSINGDYLWLFQCECGNTTTTTIGRFNYGKTSSCGCVAKESQRNRDDFHGMRNTPEYRSWRKMKERCCDPNNKDYKDYGDRGITVCDAWVNDFKQFYTDMGPKPEIEGEFITLDRIDNSKGYSKDNCRWATQKEQSRNNYGLRTNNKSGVKGVHKDTTKSKYTDYWCAHWNSVTSKVCKKAFSVKTYGEELAFFLACEYRQHQIDLLNLQGAGYSEQHTINEFCR